MNTKTAIKKLQEINKDHCNTDLKRMVARIAIRELADYDKPEAYFEDLLSHGCVSGMISDLIYYKDTHAFTKRFIEDISDLMDETEQMLGEPLEVKDDRLNWMAWFAFEETSRDIANDLGIEV